VGLICISIAGQPADKEHPYGHRKFETIASFIIAFSLFYASTAILKEGFKNIQSQAKPDVTVWSFGVMAAVLVMNISIAVWERRKGNRD